MSDIKFTITALDSASKTLDAIDKKAKSVGKNLESEIQKAYRERFGMPLSDAKKQSQMNQLFTQNEKMAKENSKKINEGLNQEIKIRNNILDARKQSQLSTVNLIKQSFEKEKSLLKQVAEENKRKENESRKVQVQLDKQKEKEQKISQKQEMFFAKQQEREQKILRKEQGDNFKRQIRIEQENKKNFEKNLNDAKNAKFTPINYIRDKKGNVIGVSGEKTTTANIANSLNLGGRTISREEAQRYGNRRGGGMVNDGGGGFLGGKRTFGQVLGGYAAYRVAVGTETAASAIINTPIELENVRASLDAMNFASGLKGKEEYKSKTKKDLEFLYKLGNRYGIDYTAVAPEFMRMQSVRASGSKKFSDKDIQNITQAFTGLSRVSGLDATRTKLVFLAVSQMLGRGKLQGQEVNQQLKEQMAISGPVIEESIRRVIFSPEIKKKNPELYKIYEKYRKKKINLDQLMEDGVLGSGILTETLGVMQDMLGGMVDEKSHTLTGSLGRFASASKQFIDLSSQQGGFPAKLAKRVDQISSGIHYFNKIGLSDELNPDNSYYDIMNAKYEGKDVSPLRKTAASGKKFIDQSLIPNASLALGVYSARKLAKKLFKHAMVKGRLAGTLLGPQAAGAVFAGGIAYDLGKEIGIAYDEARFDNEVSKFKDFYKGKYKIDAPVLPGQNNMSMNPNLFVDSIMAQTKKPQQNMSYIKAPADSAKDFLKVIDYFPKNQSLMGLNAPQISQPAEQPLQGDFPSSSKQQIELILKIEKMPEGFSPNIYTSDGRSKLNLGVNLLTGKNQGVSYAG